MRFMVIGMATKDSEAAPPPKPEQYAGMQKYNEEPVKAAILLAAEGLAPTWVKRAPNVTPSGEAVVEIRKLMDVEDFGEGFTPNPESAKVKFE